MRTALRPADTRWRSRKNLLISGHHYAVRTYTVQATPTLRWNTGSYRVRMDIYIYILVQYNKEKKKNRFCTVPRSPREYIESFNNISGRLTSITYKRLLIYCSRVSRDIRNIDNRYIRTYTIDRCDFILILIPINVFVRRTIVLYHEPLKINYNSLLLGKKNDTPAGCAGAAYTFI